MSASRRRLLLPPTALAVNSASNVNISIFPSLTRRRSDTIALIHRCNRLLRDGHKIHQ
jgi:hypothetical protein